MLVRDAKKLCPELIIVQCQFDKYEKVSEAMYRIFFKYTNLVEAVSADEAYLDITALSSNAEEAQNVVRKIREEIFTTTGITATAGIGEFSTLHFHFLSLKLPTRQLEREKMEM